MKNLKIKYLLSFFLLASIFLNALSSCSNDGDNGSSGPIINSVSPSVEGELVPVTKGDPKNVYVIQGSGFATLEKIYFNDFDTYFNPTLVTDTAIFVTIDENTPYENQSNELKIVTKSGTVTYPFIIAPPAPTLKGYNPVNAAEGDIITIKGSYFLNPVVEIGTVSVPVISSTLEEIKIKVPASADKKYITVTTISGKSKSTYAIGTAIFDDKFYGDWMFETWNNHTFESDNTAQQGSVYVKKTMKPWDNIQGNWSWDDKISDYGGLRFAIRADEPGELALIFNGNWTDTAPLIKVTKEWKEYFIPWSDLGNPTQVQNISFKHNKDANNVFYFDNIGYALK